MAATLGRWEPAEQLLGTAISASRALLDDVARDVLTVPEPESEGKRTSTSNRSTIGCMLR